MSHSSLERATDVLAGELVSVSSTHTDCHRVSLLLPRNRYYPIAVLATLKAGMAFNPLSTDCPERRIAEILDEVSPEAIITTREEYGKRERLFTGRKVLLADGLDFSAGRTFTAPEVSDDAEAMIIYTSGSSGRPKGVIHTRRSLFANARMTLGIRDGRAKRSAVVLDFGFFFANIEMLACLLNGGELHIIDSRICLNIHRLADYLADNGISRVAVTPQMARMLSTLERPGADLVVFGGSRAGGIHPGQGGTRFGVGYGSTESGASTRRILEDGQDPADIGTAYDDVRIYLLDEDLNEVPDGRTGEIYICSPRTAKGYVKDDKLTSERFIASPFEKGQILYRTGDLAVRRPEGKISLVGRSDRMIKHNGYRIYPEEVERCAEAVAGVDSAALKDESGRLVLYFAGNCDKECVRRALQASLPGHMQPGLIVKLDSMPVTGYGKTDCAMLESGRHDGLVRTIINGMSSVLHCDHVDAGDDFFSLGGDSMGVMELSLLLHDREVSPEAIHAGRTPERIAAFIRNNASSGQQDDGDIPESIPLTIFQRYIIDTTGGKSTLMWNNSMLLQLDGPADPRQIVSALKTVIDSHPLLKCTLEKESGTFRFHPGMQAQLEVIDIGESDPAETAAGLVRPFVLRDSPLYRIYILKSSRAMYLLLDFSHLISDGFSFVLFLNQLVTVMEGGSLPKDNYATFAASDASDGTEEKPSCKSSTMGVLEASASYSGPSGRALTAMCMEAAAVAIRAMSGVEKPEVSWIYINRSDSRYATSFGPFIHSRAMTVDTTAGRKGMIDSLLRDLGKEADAGRRRNFKITDKWTVEVNNLCMLADLPRVKYIPFDYGEVEPEPGILMLLIMPVQAGLSIRMEYDADTYGKPEAERFFSAFLAEFNESVSGL